MELKTPIIPSQPQLAKINSEPELHLEAICAFVVMGLFLDRDTYWKDQVVLPPANPSKIKVIPTLLHAGIFSSYAPKTHQKEPFIILSVGKHHWVKGYPYALQAMAILKAKGHLITYTIIAEGSVSEELLFLRAQYGLQDAVFFGGGFAQNDLFHEMKTYDLLLLPNLSEGIANVVLEAMALGIPVVSTDCGGMAEVVIPNETGWLVPVRDPQAIAKAIHEVMIISDQELQRITQNAHDFVKTQFNVAKSINEFTLFYDILNQQKTDYESEN